MIDGNADGSVDLIFGEQDKIGQAVFVYLKGQLIALAGGESAGDCASLAGADSTGAAATTSSLGAGG